ncbi:MAG TPA: VOC family protein [Acidimicrobiia bacterium]|nr:VOC family protein [Acidimicrobiia bacterium]
MTQSVFPIISTPDLNRALVFYRDLLGGNVTYQFPADGQPRYVGMDLGRSHIGIGVDPEIEDGSGRQRLSLWVYVDDCDAMVEALSANNVPVLEEPADQPWGERLARVNDPDGNVVLIAAIAT